MRAAQAGAGGRSIREAVAADVDGCVRLVSEHAGFSILPESFQRDIVDADRVLLVAEGDGGVVGYGRAGRFEPPPGAPANVVPAKYYLFGVVVAPAHRRRGLATALTERRLDWIVGRAREAWYFTNARNAASIALHDRLGFVESTRDFTFPEVDFAGGEGILFRVDLVGRETA